MSVTNDTTTPAARLLALAAEAEAIVGLAGSLDIDWDEEYRITVPQLAAALRVLTDAAEKLRADTDPGKLTAEQMQYVLGMALDQAAEGEALL